MNNELRKKVLEAGMKKHQSVIDDFESSIKDMRSNVINDEEGVPHSQASESTDAEVLNMVDRISNQLNFAQKEMLILQRINPDQGHQEVGFGAIVVTDKMTFFVSVSIEDFECDGKKYFGLSTDTPIYKAMEGKKAGDSFEVNGNVYKIKEVI